MVREVEAPLLGTAFDGVEAMEDRCCSSFLEVMVLLLALAVELEEEAENKL